jgi:hypothetical protein
VSQEKHTNLLNWISTYLWQARNFVFDNKFSREDFLEDCRWQSSPRMLVPETSALSQSYCKLVCNRLRPRLSLVTCVIQASGLANCHRQFSHLATSQ